MCKRLLQPELPGEWTIFLCYSLLWEVISTKLILCFFIWGRKLHCGELFFFVFCCFCLTSNKFEGNNLNLKKCLSREKATGLAISTVAQVETAKNKHTEHLKECTYLGVITSSSGTRNTVCFECTFWNISQKKNGCGLTTYLSFNEGDMQYYFEDVCIIPPYSINIYIKFTEI